MSRPALLRPVGALSALGAFVWACGSGDSALPDPDGSCPVVYPNGRGGISDVPDGVALCPKGACNYQNQKGCDSDQACRPMVDGEVIVPACSPAGAGRAGDPCTPWENDCAPGYFCSENTCRKLCCGADWTACDPGESCIRQLSIRIDDRPVATNVDLCYPVGNCDVLEAGTCGDGRQCRIVDPTGAVACATASDLTEGDSCSASSPCGAGLHCVGNRCVRLCRAEACGAPACEFGDVCVHFDRDPDGVGECTTGWKPSRADAG